MRKPKPKKRCSICHKWYEPDNRTREHQRSCNNPACKKEQKARTNKSWLKRHPGYGRSRKLKTRDWAQQYPNYWQEYRWNHPEYRDRDNKRRSSSRKQAKSAAKQDVMVRQIEGLIGYLLWKECAAKQDDMVIAPTNDP